MDFGSHNSTSPTKAKSTQTNYNISIENNQEMDILLLEPQAKHQRMYRGDSMYSEQSLLELDAIPCKDCKRSFVPKAYVRHFDMDGKPKCESVFNKKRPVFDSAKVRLINIMSITRAMCEV